MLLKSRNFRQDLRDIDEDFDTEWPGWSMQVRSEGKTGSSQHT